MSPTGSRSTWQQLYSVAATARSKLGMEAERSEHQLRLLVSHANLLDSLMEELERVKSQTSDELRQSVRWADKVADKLSEMVDEANSASDSDDSDESEDEREDIFRHTPIRSRVQRPISPRSSIQRTSTPPPPRLRPGRQSDSQRSNDAPVSRSPKLKHVPRLDTITERHNAASSDEDEDEIRTPTTSSKLNPNSLRIMDVNLDAGPDLCVPTEEEKAEAIVTSVASVICQTTDSSNPMGQEQPSAIAKGPAIAKPVAKPPKIAAAA